MRPETHKTIVSFQCPFCGLHVDAGEDADGVEQLLHMMPMCQKFEKLDPVAYMQAVNLEVARRRGVGLT